MRKRVAALLAALAVILGLSVAPVSAIQYGQPDYSGHPYVGLVVFIDSSDVPLWRCTGTLITPTVLLTAGHCTGLDPVDNVSPVSAEVFFSEGPIPLGTWGGPGTSCVGKTGYPCQGDASGTPHPNPGWTGYLTLPNTHDIGVVVLDQPVTKSVYGALPTQGVLDALATRRGPSYPTFTIVGYGLQGVRPELLTERTRMVATTMLVNLRSALTDGYNLQLSSNPGYWSGGTCFGDSGGPVFLGSSNVIVAVNSFVLNSNCKGAGFGYRVDTAESLAFVGGYTAP